MNESKKTKCKILTILMAVVLILQISACMTIYAATGMKGSGKVDDPYIITNSAQLAEMGSYLSSYFRIEPSDGTKTLTLNGYWVPIGTSTAGKQFTGTLDGNGVTIKGLKVSSSAAYQGLFGYTNGATIKDLMLEDGSVTSTASNSHAGSFVGYAKGTLTLSNCTSSLSVTGKNYVGGLVGYGNDTRITNCSYKGIVSGTSYVGGIIGKAYRETTSTIAPYITKCSVTGTVTGSGSNIGGIVGQLTGTVNQCYTTGDIKGGTYVGGIAGDLYYGNSTTSSILNCYSIGDITSISTTGYVGGIAGDTTCNTNYAHSIKYCYSTGKIYSTSGSYTGGITGNNGSSTTYSSVSYCLALNSEARQNGGVGSVGRIAGSSDYGYSNNYALSTMSVYYSTGTKLESISSSSGSKNGAVVTSNVAKTQAGYPTWDFNSVWQMSTVYPYYPILLWDAPEPFGLEIINTKYEIIIGEELLLEFKFKNPNDSIAACESSDTLIATVSSTGKITGIAMGDAVITIKTTKGAVATYAVKVIDFKPSLSINSVSIGLEIDESCRLIGLMNSGKLSKVDPATLTWTSENNQVASVDANGKVTALSLGLSLITATDKNGKSTSIYLLVEDKPPVVATEVIIEAIGYDIIDNTITINDGDRCQLTASILPFDTEDKTVKWESSNTEVAYVNASGRVSAIGIGDAIITATTKNGIEGIINVSVIIPVTSVSIDQTENIIIDLGENVEFSATVLPIDVANKTVTWKSSNNDVAIVDENGIVTGISEGETSITATAGGITSAPVIVTVLSNELVTLADWKVVVDTSSPLFYALYGEQKNIAYIKGVNIDVPTVSNNVAISATGWNNNIDPDLKPKSFLAEIPAAGYNKFQLSFEQRAADASPNDFVLEYSTDDVIWKEIAAYKVRGEDQVVGYYNFEYSFELASGSNHEYLYLRWKSVSTKNYLGNNIGVNANSMLKKVILNGQR